MSKVFVAVIVGVLAMPAESAAHRLDEYLQAARVSLARDRITLEVDLTPGANIAPAIVALLDRDGDNTISPIEAGTYGQAVLSDLALELDGRAVAVTLTRVETPSIDDMRDGIGTIQLRAAGQIEACRRRPSLTCPSETIISPRRASTWSTRSFLKMRMCASRGNAAIRGSRESGSNTTLARDGRRSCSGWFSARRGWQR